MGLIKEPKGIDFIIESHPLTPEEEAELSKFIQQRKAALKQKKLVRKAAKAPKKTARLIQ